MKQDDTSTLSAVSAEAVRDQLDHLLQDESFRTSRRSTQFLRYVVEKTLEGSTDQIKERTIGIEVFGRAPTYDTNSDHIVRTAAFELRKRLESYYGKEEHRSEVRMSLIPGSYIPRFTLPRVEVEIAAPPAAIENIPRDEAPGSPFPHEIPLSLAKSRGFMTPGLLVLCFLILAVAGAYRWQTLHSAKYRFWKPLLDGNGSVLLASGDVPDGPPTPPDLAENSVPVIHRPSSSSVPFADTVTIARISGTLESFGKRVVIRPESAISFSDMREGPVVLIGAFNNEWSLRMTKQLRYTLALDPERHLIYIRDAKAGDSRAWSWQTNRPTDHHGDVTGPVLQDYALISRIWNSQTGHVVVVIGGLYTYGTQAAGEFLSDPQLLQMLVNRVPLDDPHRNLQVVLRTTVTDGSPGPPYIVAVSSE